jgi:hypothetical protein
MRTRTKLGGGCLTVLVVIGLTLGLIYQRQELKRAHRENSLLQEQGSRLTAQVEELASEKGRLAKLIETQSTNAEQSSELLRLRGQAGRIQLQERETEQSRREQMRAAQAKLTAAEVQLGRMTKLHSENLVSADQLSQARFAAEVLRAEARGDKAEVFQIRLRQAEEQLANAAELHRQSLISQVEYDEAVRRVEALRGEARREN